MTPPVSETKMSDELKPCPFCGVALVLRGYQANPYGRCETDNCWVHEKKLTVQLDDPTQVSQWNRRAPLPSPPYEMKEAKND
jgi:hypothetical protein